MTKTKQLKLTPLALALSVGLMAAAPAHANERESLETLRQTTLNLIEALVETGVLPREKADALIQAAREKAQAQAAADAAAAPTEATPAKRVLRVPYVPESVRAQIRDEVKEEIITQARAERWGVPGAPSWMNRIKIDGDIRVRYQNDSQSKNNTSVNDYIAAEVLNVQGFSRAPDFAAYQLNDDGDFLPLANTTQSRNRERVRMRLGLTAKVSDLIDLQARYRYIWDLGDEQKTWKTDMSVATLELVMHPNRKAYVAPVAAPAPEPAPEPVMVDKSFSLSSDVLFAFGKSTLKPEGKAKLDDLTDKVKGITLEVIIAVGHTDSVGSDAYNQKLSVRRAEAVKAYLVSKGIEKNRVYTEGKGEKQPVADNKTKEGRAKNRRVEIEVVGTRAN